LCEDPDYGLNGEAGQFGDIAHRIRCLENGPCTDSGGPASEMGEVQGEEEIKEYAENLMHAFRCAPYFVAGS